MYLPLVTNSAKVSQGKKVKNKEKLNRPCCNPSTVAQGKNQNKERCSTQVIPSTLKMSAPPLQSCLLPHAPCTKCWAACLADSSGIHSSGFQCLGRQPGASTVGAGQIRTMGFVWGQFRGHSLAPKHPRTGEGAIGSNSTRVAWDSPEEHSPTCWHGLCVIQRNTGMSSFSWSLPKASFLIWMFVVNREIQM